MVVTSGESCDTKLIIRILELIIAALIEKERIDVLQLNACTNASFVPNEYDLLHTATRLKKRVQITPRVYHMHQNTIVAMNKCKKYLNLQVKCLLL